MKEQALATLKGKWGSFVGLTFIFMLLMGIATGATQFGEIFTGSSFRTLAIIMTGSGFLLTILAIPMQYGYYIAYLNSSRQDLPADIGDLFCGYRQFTRVLGTMLLATIIIMAGCFLFVVPGIILAFAYALVPYIMHDHPELSASEILQMSRVMMKGHKMDLFLLYLSFIGWALLCVLTLFIGYFWLEPYMQMTMVKFYEQLRAEFEGVGVEETPLQEEVTPAEEMQPAPEEEGKQATE